MATKTNSAVPAQPPTALPIKRISITHDEQEDTYRVKVDGRIVGYGATVDDALFELIGHLPPTLRAKIIFINWLD